MSTNVSSTQTTTSTHSTTGANFWESFQSGTGGAAAPSTLTPEINISTVKKTVEASFQVITAKSASLLSLSKAKALEACVEMRQKIQTIIESLEVISNPIQQKIEKEQRKLVELEVTRTSNLQKISKDQASLNQRNTALGALQSENAHLHEKVNSFASDLSDLSEFGIIVPGALSRLTHYQQTLACSSMYEDELVAVIAMYKREIARVESEIATISEEINKAGRDLTALRNIQALLKGMLIKHKFLSSDVDVIQTCIDCSLLTRDDITNFETGLKSCKQSFDVITF